MVAGNGDTAQDEEQHDDRDKDLTGRTFINFDWPGYGLCNGRVVRADDGGWVVDWSHRMKPGAKKVISRGEERWDTVDILKALGEPGSGKETTNIEPVPCATRSMRW